MAKNEEDVNVEEQLPLIEIAPKNQKKIAELAREYKAIVKKRVSWTDKETVAKQALLDEVRTADIPNQRGRYSFKADGLTITVTPTDERVKVKEERGE